MSGFRGRLNRRDVLKIAANAAKRRQSILADTLLTQASDGDTAQKSTVSPARDRWTKLLESQILALGMPAPEKEIKFHPIRKWRFDYGWPEKSLAVEVDGAVWAMGRHNRGYGFIADCEKLNEAVALGWRVLRFTDKHVRTGEAVNLIKRCLGYV